MAHVVTGSPSATPFSASSSVDGHGRHTIRLRGHAGALDVPRIMAELRRHSTGASAVLIDTAHLIDETRTAESAIMGFCAESYARGIRVAVLGRDPGPAAATAVAHTVLVQVHTPTPSAARV